MVRGWIWCVCVFAVILECNQNVVAFNVVEESIAWEG